MRRNPIGSIVFFLTVLLVADAVFQVTPAGAWARRTFSSVATKAQNIGPKTPPPVGSAAAAGSAGKQPAAAACRVNLSAIENAKARIKQNQPTGSVSWVDVAQQMGLRKGQKPQCPAGGSYTLGNMTVTARCSVGANGTTDTNDDHLIRKSWQ